MRILFVDEKDWTKKVPYTIHYLAEHLVKRGHHVFAIDYDDTWTRATALDRWSARQRRLIGKVDPTAAVDVTSPGFIKVPGLSRISSVFSHYQAIGEIIRRESIDCIVTYGITNALPTILRAKQFNIPVLFHSIDMLAPLVPFSWLERPTEYIEQELMRAADCVLGLTPIFAERALKLGAKRTEVIPNGVSTERLRPGLDTRALRVELGLRDADKVVLFVGTITKHVGLEIFLQHFARMERKNVKFVVVGDDIVTAGKELQRVKAVCHELGIEESVVFTGLQPADRVPVYINLADVCVSPFPPSKFSKYNIAMKVFEYMACGKPTITFQLEGTKSLVPPYMGGVVYADDHQAMIRTIAELLGSEEERLRLGVAGRRMVEERFSWEAVTAHLEQVLSSLVERSAYHRPDARVQSQYNS